MTDYTELVKALRCGEYKPECGSSDCPYWSGLGCMDGQLMDDAADAIEALQAASPWHRVEDGLPDKVGSYLVYAPTYGGGSSSEKECKAGVMFARWLKGGHWSIEVGYYKRPGCVTHWMPIEPPKEDA